MTKYKIISNFTYDGIRYFKDDIFEVEISKEMESKLISWGLIEALSTTQDLGTLEISSEVEITETTSTEEIIEETKTKKGNK